MPQTLAQKILARATGQETVTPGEIVTAQVDLAMSHDNAALVAKRFRELGQPRVWDPERIVITFDHRVPAPDIKSATNHAEVRAFIDEQHIPHFYDIKAGICHQVLPEKGHVVPGRLIVGTDSHTTTYGAFGAFATGIGRGGSRVQDLERKTGMKLDIKTFRDRERAGGNGGRSKVLPVEAEWAEEERREHGGGDAIYPTVRTLKKSVVVGVNPEYGGMEAVVEADGHIIAQGHLSHKGEMRVNRKAPEGKALASAKKANAEIVVRLV